MSARVIDGKQIAAAIREEIRQRVLALQSKTGKVPGPAYRRRREGDESRERGSAQMDPS